MSSSEDSPPDPARPIPVNIPKFWGSEKDRVAQQIEDGWISSEGPAVAEFEKKVAQICDRKYAVACANGTAALDIFNVTLNICFHVLNIKPGDEVIIPDLTIISCVGEVVKRGGVPVFVDCVGNNKNNTSGEHSSVWNFDLKKVEQKITARTKAILAVHVYEFPCDMDALKEIVERSVNPQCAIIEDAAEMMGGMLRGKPCGSFGDISTFSFYPNKQVTTGEGGIFLTNSDTLYEKARMSRNLCFDPKGRRFVHEDLGFNYRMTCLQAALGIVQLEHLQDAVKRRREIGSLYTKILSKNETVVKNLRLPVDIASDTACTNMYWVYMIEILNVNITAEQMMGKLAGKKVGTRPCFYPLHAQPVFLDVKSRYYQPLLAKKEREFENASRLAEKSFYIPSGLGMIDDDVELVCERVIAVCEEIFG